MEQKYKTKVIVAVADVLDETAARLAFEKFHKDAGKVDVLVHNAGYMSDLLSVQDSEIGEWWKSFEINIKGAFIVTRAFVPVAAENAVLVAISTGAVSLVLPKTTAYLVSKFAAARLFEYIQAEFPNIRIHNIHPGGIETQMAVKTRDAGMDIPMDDISLPSAFTVWAASGEAAFTKGKFLWCNWDVDELKELTPKITNSTFLSLGLDGWPFV